MIRTINADGQGGATIGHKIRTILFHDLDRLYISVGCATEVDQNSERSCTQRFDLSNGIHKIIVKLISH